MAAQWSNTRPGGYVEWGNYDSEWRGKTLATASPAPSNKDEAGEEGYGATSELDAPVPAPLDQMLGPKRGPRPAKLEVHRAGGGRLPMRDAPVPVPPGPDPNHERVVTREIFEEQESIYIYIYTHGY